MKNQENKDSKTVIKQEQNLMFQMSPPSLKLSILSQYDIKAIKCKRERATKNFLINYGHGLCRDEMYLAESV